MVGHLVRLSYCYWSDHCYWVRLLWPRRWRKEKKAEGNTSSLCGFWADHVSLTRIPYSMQPTFIWYGKPAMLAQCLLWGTKKYLIQEKVYNFYLHIRKWFGFKSFWHCVSINECISHLLIAHIIIFNFCILCMHHALGWPICLIFLFWTSERNFEKCRLNTFLGHPLAMHTLYTPQMPLPGASEDVQNSWSECHFQ